tara:strand:+ start:124 stop:597 length:474 start_codon:yes stop_codon:yes gene_type:complete
MSLKQGKFKPKHYKKYKGDPTDIFYRSGWELKFMNWCDQDKKVVSWSSEEIVIPYKCPTDNRVHRYFPDFWVKVKEKNVIKEYLVEVKPLKQTMEPKPQKRQTKRYITEVLTYAKNDAKWRAAKEYCLDRGIEFRIITERELRINYPAPRTKGKKSK